MAAVQFVYADWIAAFPTFAGCSSAQGQSYFNLADFYFQNDACNPAYGRLGVERFTLMLYLVTSHIAWLTAPKDANGNPSSTGQTNMIVGRIASAGEGSVNVSIELKDSGSPSEAFFSQTEWGLMFWQATAGFRTFQYAAQPTLLPSAVFAPFPRRFF